MKIFKKNSSLFCYTENLIRKKIFMAEFNDKKKESLLEWFKVKIELELSRRPRKIFFSEGEIWWASIGSNIGHEEDGKNEKFERPVLILRKFSDHLILAIPLSSKHKHNRYYFRFLINNQYSSALISQIRTLSSKRLIRRMGVMGGTDFNKIRQRIKSI
jgi:mRNA interferase MazF